MNPMIEKQLIAWLAVLMFCIHYASAQKGPNDMDELIVVKCDDFEVTGSGNDPQWEKASWVNLTQQQTRSPYVTRFKIMYSDSGIYCLYHCADNQIHATLQGNNLDLWTEDVVEAFFWADEAVPVYFEYELSPLNYELVLLVPNYNGNFLGWAPWHYSGNRLTRHAVTHQTTGDHPGTLVAWRAEYYIPFELMKPMVTKTPEKGTCWRANFYRIDHDNPPGMWSWVPFEKHFHEFRTFGTICFR